MTISAVMEKRKKDNMYLCFALVLLCICFLLMFIDILTDIIYQKQTEDMIKETRRLAVINRLRSERKANKNGKI